MKQFMVAMAVLPILMFFAIQFTHGEARHSRQLRLEEAVHNARLEAAVSGGFDGPIRGRLVAEAAAIFGVAEGDIEFWDDGYPASPGSFVSYRLKAPAGGVIAAASMLGISKEENASYCTVEGKVYVIRTGPEGEAASLAPTEAALR